jgi:hypothetical protein
MGPFPLAGIVKLLVAIFLTFASAIDKLSERHRRSSRT